MRRLGFAAFIAIVFVSQGCRKPDAAKQVLARVGAHDITAADLQLHVEQSAPLLRARYAAIERRRELLESLVREELLAQEAERRHLDTAPAVRLQQKRAMVQELLRTEFESRSAAAAASDAEVKKYFDEHPREFVRPEMARVAHLFLVADARSRPSVKVEAEKLRRELDERLRAGDASAFESAVRKRSSDSATRESGGALRFMTKEELASAIGMDAAHAAFSLEPGGIAGPFPTERGFELVRLEVKTVGMNRPFSEARESIRAQIERQSQGRTYEELIKNVRGATTVSIDETALAAVPLNTAAATASASVR
jgi:peptidyl-prolyl cis-trans isomerase C